MPRTKPFSAETLTPVSHRGDGGSDAGSRWYAAWSSEWTARGLQKKPAN